MEYECNEYGNCSISIGLFETFVISHSVIVFVIDP